MMNSHPTTDFWAIDSAASRLGLKSRLAANWRSAFRSTGFRRGKGVLSGPILFGLCGGCFRPLQKQNLPPATLALRCGREAKIGTAAGPAAPQSASTFRVRHSVAMRSEQCLDGASIATTVCTHQDHLSILIRVIDV